VIRRDPLLEALSSLDRAPVDPRLLPGLRREALAILRRRPLPLLWALAVGVCALSYLGWAVFLTIISHGPFRVGF
jgi:hypothetical protein